MIRTCGINHAQEKEWFIATLLSLRSNVLTQGSSMSPVCHTFGSFWCNQLIDNRMKVKLRGSLSQETLVQDIERKHPPCFLLVHTCAGSSFKRFKLSSYSKQKISHFLLLASFCGHLLVGIKWEQSSCIELSILILQNQWIRTGKWRAHMGPARRKAMWLSALI